MKFVCACGLAVACSTAALGDVASVRADLGVKFLAPGADLSSFTAVFDEVATADRAADAAWRSLSSRAEFDAYRKMMWLRMVDAIGGFPEKTPLNARVVGTAQCDGYSVEKVIFESMPGVYVTGLFFRPSSASAPLPTVVVTCGHSLNGKNFWGYQRACVQLAKRGMNAFIYDPFEQGDRLQVPEGKGCCGGHNLIGVRAMLLGDSMAKYRIWDGVRAIDYVLSRPDVKKGAIGYQGQSGGGTMTSLMMAIDDRIRVAAPSCYLTNMRELAMHCGPQDAEQNIFGQLSFGLNHASYVLMQDIPVLMVCRKNDFFPYYGTCETFDVVCELAAKLGTDGRYRLLPEPGPHGWIDSTREASAIWMEKWLAGGKALPDPAELQFLELGVDVKKARDCGLPEDEAAVPPTGKVVDLPGFRSILDVLCDRLSAFERGRHRLSPDERAALAKKYAKVKTAGEASARIHVVSEGRSAGRIVRRIAIGYPNQLVLPAVLFIPEKKSEGAVPALVVSNGGRTNSAEVVSKLLDAGRPVMALDYTASGEIGAAKHVFYGAADAPEEEVGMLLYWLGDSLVGRRATDILVAADCVKAACGSAPELFADGAAVVPAAHAHAADPGAFSGLAATNRPESWASIVRGRSARIRFFNCVNGALRDYDWPDLLP